MSSDAAEVAEFARRRFPIAVAIMAAGAPALPERCVEAAHLPTCRVISAVAEDRIHIDPDKVRVEGDPGLSTRDVRRGLEGISNTQDLQESLAALGRALLADGFMEAELRLRVEPDGETVLFLHRGDGAELDSVSVTSQRTWQGAGSARPDLRRGRFTAGRFEDSIWLWVDKWIDSGHPFAWAQVESLDVREGRIRAHIRFDPGPAMIVKEVRFPGRAGTRQAFLERWVRFRPGRLYRGSEWARAGRRLEQIGLFEWVESHGLTRIGPNELMVSIPVREGPHNRLEGLLGYCGQTQGVSGFLDLELGNLFGTGRRLAVFWERVRTDQDRIRLNYREPMLWTIPAGMRLRLEQEERDSTYSQVVAEARVETSIAADLAVSGGIEYRRALLGLEPAERILRISSVVGLSWDTIRPNRWQGGRFSVDYWSGDSRVRPPGGGQSRTVRLDRVEADSERFWRLKTGWASRLRIRGAALSRADSLPPSEALRLGGIASLRGYDEEELSTCRNVSVQLEAGPVYSEGRLYLFLDTAWYRREAVGSRDADALAYGLGLASETAARGVSLDLGLRRGAALREGRLHVRLQARF